MIDPISAAAAGGALAEITGSMSGLSIAQAYEQNMTGSYDPYDPLEAGVSIGYGNYTSETPAISGDTENTFEDSAQSDPQEAWLDWMHNGGSVNQTTGGAVLGSDGSTINYSIMEDSNGDPQAVQPVAIPVDTAVVAIAQCLGVSMKVSDVDPILAGKMTRAMVAAGVVYDKARDLFTCWWDGVNLLFPKKAVESLDDLFEEEGIPTHGQSPGGSSSSDLFPNGLPYAANSYSWDGPGDFTYAFEISGGGYAVAWKRGSSASTAADREICATSTPNSSVTYTLTNKTTGQVISTTSYQMNLSYTHNGLTVYYKQLESGISTTAENVTIPIVTGVNLGTKVGEAAWTLVYGTHTQTGYPDGMQQSLAQSYSPSDLSSSGSIVGKNGNDEYAYTPVVPISLPEDPTNTTTSTENPIGATNPERTKENEKEPPVPLPIPKPTESDPSVELTNPTVIDAAKISELVEDLANTVDPQPPQSTGEIMIPPFMPGTPVDPDDPTAGSQFPTIVPSSGSGFIHVYNPTPAEFVSFGQWLWVTYADATIEKIWNNPFDGVLGAHELYATPGVSGRDNIRSGFLVCPTSANLVPNRYTEIDCGSVVVPEFYGNYLDYSPYSQCYIYLPFIGINEVSIDDIVGHAVNIRYRVDSYSGACIAMIYVAKQGYRNLCYQFAGNCAVEVPLAGGSQAAIKAGMMQAEAYGRAAIQSAQIQKTAKIGTGIVQGAHSGAGAGAFNPVAGIVGGLLGGLAGGTAGYIQGAADYGAAKLSAGAMQEAARVANKSSVQHSGQFGASHGAMGLKVPFIMIRNPIQVKVTNYNKDYGFPAHKRVIIGGCTGYLRVKEVNVVSAHATNEEKIAIEEALKNGVYVS